METKMGYYSENAHAIAIMQTRMHMKTWDW